MIVDLFLVYQFVRRLATPFNKWEAYKLGIIDEKGKVLMKRKDFTKRAQREAWGRFDILVANIKKLLGKIPGGQSRMASYAAALYLIKEHNYFEKGFDLNEGIPEEDIDETLLEFQKRYIHYTTLVEDVNSELMEKLKASDDMGDWIKDFYKSDAPQFKGKSKAKRRQMAIAAKLGAERNEDLDELSLSLKDLKKTGLNKKAHGDKDKLKKDLEKLKKGLEEAATVRWKRAGANGEIQATIGGKKYQIEKALDHNERHKGEWKVMVWDKRRDSWEWETTEYGKANAKAWIMDRLKEDTPANSVAAGGIEGMDGTAFSKAAQKKWTSQNKSKKKKLRDIMNTKGMK